MYSTDYSIEDIFSPLNGDTGVLMEHIDVGNKVDPQPEPHLQAMYMNSTKTPHPPRQYTIPRKQLPVYQKVPMSHDSYISTQTDSSDTRIQMEKDAQVDAQVSVEEITDEEPKRSWQFYGTFGCLAILNLICAIDATILSVALPTIATDLKGTTAIQAFWCGTSFLLCSTVFQPTWASFSHIIGRKSILLSALFLFTLGTILASVANHIAILLAGRSIQGVGGGGLVGLTYVIMSDLVSLRDRGKWMAIISLQWAIGSVIGPVIGGLFAERTSWRWIFWLNIPFCVIAAVGIPVCLRLHPREGSLWARLKTFDWIGSFFFIASTTSLLIPLTWGGVMYDWQSWRTLVPLLIGIGGLVGFVVYSVQFSSEPLIRRSLFNSRTALIAYAGTIAHGMIVWALLYYMPLYFEVAKNYTPVMSGVGLFPLTFTIAPAAVAVGIIITKTGRYRPSIWTGWFLTTLGMGLQIYLNKSTNTPSWVFLSLVTGIGTGVLFSAQGFAAQASASNADIPFAGALYSFFRALGQTLGVAISGVVFQNTFKNKIAKSAYAMYADEWSRDASSFVQIVKTWSTEGSQGVMRGVVVVAYVESLRMVWVILCVLAGLTFVANVLWTDEISLKRELETEQGFRFERRKGSTTDESSP